MAVCHVSRCHGTVLRQGCLTSALGAEVGVDGTVHAMLLFQRPQQGCLLQPTLQVALARRMPTPFSAALTTLPRSSAGASTAGIVVPSYAPSRAASKLLFAATRAATTSSSRRSCGQNGGDWRC